MALPIEALQDLARQKAAAAGIDPDLFVRQITQESNWDPRAVGPPTKYGQAKGLGQFIPGTAKQFGLIGEDVFDPEKNLTASAQYMRQLKDQFGTMDAALAAYNFGPGNVGGGRPWPAETRNYVAKIMGGNPAPRGELRAVPVNPAPRGELRAAAPEGLREMLYNRLFSSLNTGLPDLGKWMGEPDLPDPVEPTTGELLGGAVTAASLMGGGLPLLARAGPSLLGMNPFALSPLRLAAGMAQSAGFGQLGGEAGEAIAGQTGRDIGEAIGSNIGFSRLPRPMAERIWGIPIPPIGPLEGTKVLTKEGLAQPVAHGSPVDFPDYDPQYFQRGRFGLKGVWSTTQPQEASKAYAGVASPGRTQKTLKQKEQELRQNLKQQAKLLAPFSPVDRQAIQNNFQWDQLNELSGYEPYARKAIAQMKLKGHHGWHIPDEIQEVIDTRKKNLISLWDSRSKEYRLREELAELQGGTEVSAATNTGSNPHLRPQYLALKNPFDLDKVTGPEEIDALRAAVRQWMDASRTHGTTQIRGRGFLKDLDNTPEGITNDKLFNLVKHHFKLTEAQRMVERAGFDGFTHIGHESHHRVYITAPDKVIPAFDPRLTEAQADRARQAMLEKRLKYLRAENEQLRRKAAGMLGEDDPRHHEDVPFATKERNVQEKIKAHIQEGYRDDIAPHELPYFAERTQGKHPILDKFMAGVEKAYIKYHKTGELTPLIHKSNSEGEMSGSTTYPELADQFARAIRDASDAGNPPSHRWIIQMIDAYLTPAAQQEWKSGKFDWRKDIK